MEDAIARLAGDLEPVGGVAADPLPAERGDHAAVLVGDLVGNSVGDSVGTLL